MLKNKLYKLPIVALTILLFLCLLAAVGIYAYGNFSIAQAAEITAPETMEELREADPYEVAKASYFDGRQYGYLTPVRNQGSSNTCWAHAVIGAVEASILREGIDPNLSPEELDLSEFNLAWQSNNRDGSVDPLGNTPGFEYSGEWNVGTSLSQPVLALMQWAAPRQTYGEDDFRFAKEGEVKYILEECIPFSMNKTEEIKAAVAKYGAVALVYYSGELFDNIYYSSKGISTGQHASVIVGWDDNIPASYFQGGKPPTINGGWLIRNSWGTDYHDNGYFWLSYDGINLSMYAFDMGLRSDYGNNYYYDGIYNGSVSLSGNPIKVCAIYEAKGGNDEKCELVKGANVNVRGTNVEITVDFYKNVTANKNDNCNVKVNLPESGIHVATVTRTVSISGFYYIELDKKDWFAVEKGTYFSAVVTLSTSGISCGIGYCYETGSNKAYDMTYYFNPQTGQWINSAEYMIGNHGCVFGIKCFTVFADYKFNKDISESEISLERDSFIYTGSTIEPSVTVTYENKVLTSSDYTVSYVNNVNAGEASVIIKGIGDYTGIKTVNFTIEKAKSPGLSFNDLNVEYQDGEIRTAENAERLSDIPLPEGWEWQNADLALVNEMEAIALYVGADKENYENLTITLRIIVESVIDSDTDTDTETGNGNYEYNKNISESEISLERDSFIYTGSTIEPSVTVTYENKVLTSSDYTVSYVNNVNAGEATVIIEGIGDYTGIKTVNFTIEKAKSPGLSFSDLNVEYQDGEIRAAENAERLSDIPLPEGWEWQNADSALVNEMEAIALYVGADKENYENLTITLRIIVESVIDSDTDTDTETGNGDNVDTDTSKDNSFEWAWLTLPLGIIIIGVIAYILTVKGRKEQAE